MKKENIVPGQYTGKKIDTEIAVECGTEEEAKTLYQAAKEKLLDVNHWHEVAGKALAKFHITDANGQEVNRTVREGDYFKIDIPGPGSKTGEGYDWVRVESVDETEESTGVRVRPAPNPTNKDEQVAHFYSEQSTSNFIVTREGKKVTASVYDRNTSTNEEAGNVADAIRNSTVGAGAITFFSKIQWTALVNGLLKRD
jgi:hypothetical protein